MFRPKKKKGGKKNRSRSGDGSSSHEERSSDTSASSSTHGRSSSPTNVVVKDESVMKKEATGGVRQTEVYGFMFWILTSLGFVCYLVWAFIPEEYFQQVGISYYPNRYWAVSIPALLLATIFFVYLFYLGINLRSTVPINSFYSVTDEKYQPPQEGDMDAFVRERTAIPPPADLSVTLVNRLLYQRGFGKDKTRLKGKGDLETLRTYQVLMSALREGKSK